MMESNRLIDFHKQADMNGRLLTENAELRQRIAELEAALKPFADEAQFFVSKALDNHLAAPDRLYLTIGQFRAARKALGEKE
jgi:hypothetical protein